MQLIDRYILKLFLLYLLASVLVFVTLFVGLIVSMYTAVFVTRTYYIWRIQDRNFTEMSI